MSTAANADIFDSYKQDYDSTQAVEMSLVDYLKLCKEDRSAYASPAERLLKAIGEPETIETGIHADPRLSRIFENRKIQCYPAFNDFFGAEETIMKIVGFLKKAAQGGEESRQVLYLLGPVGGGKSSLATRLAKLMEKEPFYALKYNPTGEVSPINENPLGLFCASRQKQKLKDFYGIADRYVPTVMSGWAAKRLKESGGNLADFSVVKVWPSITGQTAISRVEPSDPNTQDATVITGGVDISKVDELSENDPDSYSYSGGLCTGNRGIMEFPEMFKADIKLLNPLLMAPQEGRYQGTKPIGALPFEGIVIAHSNESEWESFRNNKKNEAFLDRVSLIRVPYCLRVDEEMKIYQKVLGQSDLATAPCAPDTLKMLAKWSVLTRLAPDPKTTMATKMRVYNGENLKDKDVKVLPIGEYRANAGIMEGMNGSSTRFAFKVLTETFNMSSGALSANPINLMHVLETEITAMQLPDKVADQYKQFIRADLEPEYLKFLDREIKTAYVESYSDYGQNLFDKYVTYAEQWGEDTPYKDPETHVLLDKAALGEWLEKIERPAGITNGKDFRSDVVKFVLRAQAKTGHNPSWTSYEPLKEVIEKKMFSSMEEILPVISYGGHRTAEESRKHDGYVERMKARNYTESDVKLVTEYYMRKHAHP